MTVTASSQKAIPIAVLCLFLSPPAMAQGVGAIGGTVKDSTGGALPGVSVSLSNPGVIGGNQQTVTDERGAYQFARLVPGSAYTVQAELSGFGTATGKGIVVNADATTRLDLTLQVAGLAETVTVAGASPLVDTTSVFHQTVMDRQVLDALPSGRDLWTIARIVPGVLMNSYDVGGAASLLQGSATVHGATLSENAYMVDGMDAAAPTTPGSTNSYFDTSMFEEVNYQTGNSSAESEFGGIVYNMVTKTGTNVFHGSSLFTGTNSSLNANNITPEMRTDLLAAIPARLLQAHPEIDPLGKILSFYDAEASLWGPLVRDKLWFTGNGNLKKLNQLRVGSYNPDGTQFVNDNRQINYGAKFSWQATQGNQLHYVHQFSQRIAYHRVSDALGFYESNAAGIQDVNSSLDIVKWTAVLSSRLVLDISANAYRSKSGSQPEPGVKAGDIPAYDVVTRRYTVAAATYGVTQPGLYGAHANVTYLVGSHDLKFGYEPKFRWSEDQNSTYSVSHYPSGLRANFRDGVPDSVNTYSTPVHKERVATMDHAVFIQDKWRATSRLTLNLGVRLQKTNGWVPANCQVETIFVGAQCFSELNNVPNWLDLAPRVGMVYDIFGDGKTALKLAANRYSLTEGTSHVSRVNPVSVKSDTRKWTDTNNDLIPQLNELGPSSGFNLGTTNRYNPDLKRPYSDEFNVELEHQLPGNSVVSVGYYRRNQHRNIGSKNLLVPLESYTPLVVTEKVSGQQVTVYNQAPTTLGKFDVLFDNFPELDRDFNGMDLTFNKRLSNRWMIISGLSLGRNIGDTYGTSDLNNPNFTFRRGLFFNSGYTSWGDVPVSLKVSGMYELPHGIKLSGNAQHFTGYPEQDTVVVTASTVALTQVSQSVRIAPLGTNRLPDSNIVDLNVRKTFKLRGQLTAEPVMEVFNLTNGNTITARSTQLGPTYHRVVALESGRMWRFGFNVKF